MELFKKKMNDIKEKKRKEGQTERRKGDEGQMKGEKEIKEERPHQKRDGHGDHDHRKDNRKEGDQQEGHRDRRKEESLREGGLEELRRKWRYLQGVADRHCGRDRLSSWPSVFP